MQAKKTEKADLEKRRGLYLEIGLVVVLVAALVAFNVKSYDNEKIEVTQRTAEDEIEEQIIQTQDDTPPPPPPPEPEVVTTEVNVIENDAESDKELNMDVFDKIEKQENIEIAPVQVEQEEEEAEDEIFQVVEQDPEYPGGVEALYKFIQQNLKYPQLAKENNITGRVFVQFVVEKDGSVSNVKAARDIGGGCGAEAVRVIKAMPKWTPGKQRGKAVRAAYTLPVNFVLQ
ncbi:MAG: energy transducer TonB [Bacteroidales bacterium]|nr:energy transducer TonB [Bacteroidales bacterium]